VIVVLIPCCAAVWLAKRGHLLNELRLDLAQMRSDRAAAEIAVAAALQAAAAGSRTGSLHITSCNLFEAGPSSTAILQALPASKLTSVAFNFSVPYDASAEDTIVSMVVLGHALSSLQQLRQLKLSDNNCMDGIGMGLALQSMSGLTNLTSLTLQEVRYDACMQINVHCTVALGCEKRECCSLLLRAALACMSTCPPCQPQHVLS
jgi:hypothetical protein